MENILESYLNWPQFFLLCGIITGVYFLLIRFKSYFVFLTKFHSLHIPNSILLILVIVLFVLINPRIHGFIVLVGLALIYPVITSYLKGIIVSNNSKIQVGDLIQIGKNKGKISSINFSGIKLLTQNNNVFIPYSVLSKETIKKFESDQSRYLSFNCKGKEEHKITSIDIERIVFNFPFLAFDSKIDITQLEETFQINLTLANERFRTSLFKQFDREGIEVLKQQIK